MTSKTPLIAIAGVAAALMSTAAFSVGAAPTDPDSVSKTTIGAPSVPVTTPPGTVPPVTAAPTTAPTPPTAAAVTTLVTVAPVVTVPAGAMRLNDETGRITVVVPNTWLDTSTAPATGDDGSERQRIVASPDIDAMWETWTTPGVWMTAVPGTVDVANWFIEYEFSRVCSGGSTEPVNDGRFVGTKRVWQNCGGGTAQIVQLAVRSADGTFGVYAQIQTVTADDPALAMILGSIGLVPGATMGSPTTVPGPVTTVGPADPTLVGAAVPADAIRIVDDTGRFALSVPASWADTDTSAQVNDDGSDRPSIYAAPSIDAFVDRWDSAGLYALLLPYVDPATYLSHGSFAGCTDGGLKPIATATHSGFMQTWTGCGGTAGQLIEVAIAPADLSSTFTLLIQLPDPDNTPLAVALASFAVL